MYQNAPYLPLFKRWLAIYDNKALTLCTVLNASKACHISIVFERSLLCLYFERRECNNELFIPHLDEFCVWHLPYSFCFIYLTHVDLFHLASGIHIHTCLSPAQRSWNGSILKSVLLSTRPWTQPRYRSPGCNSSPIAVKLGRGVPWVRISAEFVHVRPCS